MVELNNDGCQTYNTIRQITFQTAMLRSILYGCNKTYTLAEGGISNVRAGVNGTARATDRKNENVIFETCDYISRSSYSINTIR